MAKYVSSRRQFLHTSSLLAGGSLLSLPSAAQSAAGSIRITNVETIALGFETLNPHSDAIHLFNNRGAVVTKVHTDAGITGWGHSYFGTIPNGPKTLKYLIDQELAPIIIGQDPFDSRKIRADLWRATEYQGVSGLTHFGISAIDTAIWDIVGKALELPVHKVLGSCHDRLPAYAMVGWYFGTPEEYADSCREAVDEGFRAIKIKVGAGLLSDDLRRLETARKTVGPDVRLMADANQALSVQEAIRRGRAYEDYDLFWFEEPLPPWEKGGYAELTRTLDVPIATGENEYTKYAFKDLIERDAVDIVQPDIRRAGGVLEWLEIGAIAKAFGKPLASHGGGPPQLNILCAIPAAIYMESGSLKGQSSRPEKLRLVEGEVLAPTMPGMGSEYTPDYIEKNRIG
jgi:L-alanine-DL-glutamate epimerase-like enolase superfamily enzyme